MATGVIVVTYHAEEVILDCLESLLASRDVDLRILVVDNASQDSTVSTIQSWAHGQHPWDGSNKPFQPVAHGPLPIVVGEEHIEMLPAGTIGVLRLSENQGFAAGVNAGLRVFIGMPEVANFWILNPDCMAEANTAQMLVEKARTVGKFGIIGGRVFYTSPSLMVQSEGGRVNLWSGTCIPFNLGQIGRDVLEPPADALDYIAGSHMFVSRDFLAQAGLIPEDYFLYFEEVDWCLRRGDLPLLACAGAAVHHHGGHTIGSATLAKAPSPLSAYFMTRSRLKFVARWHPVALPYAWTYTLLKAARFLLRRQHATGLAMMRALLGRGPSRDILALIGRRDLPS